ncbi:response regulator [Candidatus Saccharibacteria bacterium]|nr:response regulator [Candidatus Saccharibacteria bacterium]
MAQKIAIVEDEAAIRRMYAFKLKYSDFVVVEAEDGEKGLTLIEVERPDLVLLDLRMPRMTGEEMLRELRATDWGEEIPVVILTNISKDEAPRTLWHLGISDFIVKSNATPQKVVECVEKILLHE